MNSQTNFIEIYKNVFPQDLCQKYIDYFDTLDKNNLTYIRENIDIKDRSTNLIKDNFFKEISINYLTKDFLKIFFDTCYQSYINKYPVLNHVQTHGVVDMKIQKTLVGGGYHNWHAENQDFKSRNRIFVFMLYLNDVNEGGETEFIYLNKRIKPEKNLCVIWPAGFTHTHRGNPPISNDKYAITGWGEYLG